MWPFLTLSTSFSCRAFKARPKKTLTCISWYRQRRPIFASFKMAPIHNRLANAVRKGTQRPASSCAVPVRSVMVTSRSGSVVVSSLWVCSTGRGWMASECFRAVLNMRDLQENMLFNLQKHMGNVPTVCLCELTDLIKKIAPLLVALFNVFEIFLQEQQRQPLQTFMHTCWNRQSIVFNS